VIIARSDLRAPDLEVHDVLRELNLGDEVRIINGLPEDDLVAAYSAARAFISVALYEGFGLPIVEAMACGTAVVASDIEVFREVAGDAATFVNPTDEKEIAAALQRAASDDDLVQIMQTKGLARSERFTWQQTAYDTLATYRSAVAADESGAV
jgi:alpha-1,3-rhamnosyl/mannosyltransferase